MLAHADHRAPGDGNHRATCRAIADRATGRRAVATGDRQRRFQPGTGDPRLHRAAAATAMIAPTMPGMPRETRMFAEAREAADAIARQLPANAQAVRELASALRAQPPRFIVTC